MKKIKQFLLRNYSLVRRHFLGRSILFVLFGGSLALLGWVMKARYPLIEQKQAEVNQIFRLEDEVSQLAMAWSDEEDAQADIALAEAYEFIFFNGQEIASWLSYVNSQSNEFSFILSAQQQSAQPIPGQENALALVSATCNIRPAMIGSITDEPYKDALVFLQHLVTNQLKRVDIARLSASGDGRSINQINVGMQLWSQATTNR